MHVFALPTAQRDALAQSNGPKLALKVTMTATVRTVTSFNSGVPTFGNTWENRIFDLSDRLRTQPTISQSRPVWPDSDPFSRSEIDIEIVNTDGYLACLQSGAMVRLADIEQATVLIEAVIDGGSVPNLTLFKGRVIGPPSEARGVTTFTVVDTLWDALRVPVLYEDWSNIAGSQDFDVVQGLLYPDHREINTLAGGYFCAFNGCLEWDAQGDLRPRYENSDAAKIDVKKIILQNEAKPGQYVITFQDQVNFTLTYPDNEVYRGAISSDTITPKVSIPKSAWTTRDGLGVKITFGVGPCLRGNPVTIARNFVEKALLQNWGLGVGNTFQVLMDVAAWDAMETRFRSYEVFVSATNEDNAVWNRKRGQETRTTPLNCLELAQQVLDHVGAMIQMRRDGLISITAPFLDGSDVWPLSTVDTITDVKVQRGDQWNWLTAQYGEYNGAFAAKHDIDARLSGTDIIADKVISLPFYKAGHSRFRAHWMARTYLRRYYERQHLITVSVIPQMALPIICGDLIEIESTSQPAFRLICEVVSVSISLYSECDIELVPVQQYEGEPFKIDVARLDLQLLW